MRDLSKSSLGSKKRVKTVNFKVIKVVLPVVLLAGLFFVVKNLDLGGISGSVSANIHEAPRGLVPVEIGSQVKDITKGAVDLKTEKTVLEDVKSGDGKAEGTAARSYGGGTYILTVEATLPNPGNVDYEVWLAGGGEVIPIDFMQKGSGNTWSLNITSAEDYSKYNNIWITLERTKDGKPEEHVMEGTF